METLEGNVAKDLAAMESELKDTMAVNQKENKSIANANQAELKNILSELESGLKDQADQNLTQIVNQFSGFDKTEFCRAERKSGSFRCGFEKSDGQPA